MPNIVMTTRGREKIAKALSGELPLAPITKVGWGKGGHDPTTRLPMPPSPDATFVPGEFLQKQIDSYSFPVLTTVRFKVSLLQPEGNGQSVSAAGLYDSTGELIIIMTFTPKDKESNSTIEIECDQKL